MTYRMLVQTIKKRDGILSYTCYGVEKSIGHAEQTAL